MDYMLDENNWILIEMNFLILPESTARWAGIWFCPIIKITSHNSFCFLNKFKFSMRNLACLSEILINLLLHGEQSLSISIVVLLWFSCWIELKHKFEKIKKFNQLIRTKTIVLYPSSPFDKWRRKYTWSIVATFKNITEDKKKCFIG